MESQRSRVVQLYKTVIEYSNYINIPIIIIEFIVVS